MFDVPASKPAPKKPKERPEGDWISDIVGVFYDPIIVSPGGWGDTLPDWVKQAIKLERLMMNVKVVHGEQPTGTDCEAMAYLYTRSLEAPMGHDWSQIYLYIAGKCYERWGSIHGFKSSLPEDIRVTELDRNQMSDLNELKGFIYRARIKARKEKERQERREKKQEAAEEYVSEQMPLL
jgi:hypothetical protein